MPRLGADEGRASAAICGIDDMRAPLQGDEGWALENIADEGRAGVAICGIDDMHAPLQGDEAFDQIADERALAP